MHEIFSCPNLFRYNSKFLSTAFLFNVFIILIIIIVPLVIIVPCSDIFKESNLVNDRMHLKLNKNIRGWLTFADLDMPFAVLAANETSLFGHINAALASNIETKSSTDGSTSIMFMEIKVPRTFSESLQEIIVILDLSIILPKLSTQSLQTIKFISIAPERPVTTIEFAGSLSVNANKLITNSLIIKNAKNLQYPKFEASTLTDWKKKHYDSFSNNKESMFVINKWFSTNSFSQTATVFTLKLKLFCVDNVINVQSSFWYALKFAWVQYICVAVFLIFLMEELRAFVYMRQIVTTTTPPSATTRISSFTSYKEKKA